jgi:uncharacterized protein with HEPN domain
MDQADLIRLRHMLDAATEALGFASGKSQEHIERDRMLVLAVLKDLEIIGEAANRVSVTTRNQYPAVPWADIIGMRNQLIHGYFDVDVGVVWDTITNDLPPLVLLLEEIVRA